MSAKIKVTQGIHNIPLRNNKIYCEYLKLYFGINLLIY